MVINGKTIAEEVYSELQTLLDRYDVPRKPKIAILLIGNREDSLKYIKGKMRKCEELGFLSELLQFDETSDVHDVVKQIDVLNHDESIDGILVQMPLPYLFIEKNKVPHTESVTRYILDSIDPNKDIDGLTATNIGKYVAHDKTGFIPATAQGVMKILQYISIDLTGKHVVIIGRSLIVGKPIAQLCLEKNAGVTMLHSHVSDISYYTMSADVIILAAGKPNLLNREMVHDQAVVIDVGISVTDGKLYGDADFSQLQDYVKAITPVPGGVGPLTIAYIMYNLGKAYIYNNDSTKNSVS